MAKACAGHTCFYCCFMFWGFPQLVAVLYTLLLALGVKYTAILGWWMGVIFLLGLINYVDERIGKGSGWIAAVSLAQVSIKITHFIDVSVFKSDVRFLACL